MVEDCVFLSRGGEHITLIWTLDRDWTLDSGGKTASEGCREPEGVMWVKGLTLRGGKTRKPTLLVEVMILCTEIGGQSGLMIGGE